MSQNKAVEPYPQWRRKMPTPQVLAAVDEIEAHQRQREAVRAAHKAALCRAIRSRLALEFAGQGERKAAMTT